MLIIVYLLIGFASGSLISVIGTGAGLIIIPALMFFAGFSEKMAVGTSLSIMLLPIGAFAAYTYYNNGLVNVRAAAWIIVGFVIGSFLLAKVATGLPTVVITRLFGIVAILIGVRMVLL